MKLKYLLFALITLSLTAQEKETIQTKKFSVPEYDDKGKLNCVINGDQGKIFGKEAHITGVFVEIHHKDSPLHLTTPKCKYLLDKKRCSSNEDVKIKGDGVVITGKGFDIDNNDKKIFIRSNVKVVWKKAKNKLKKNSKTDKAEDKK